MGLPPTEHISLLSFPGCTGAQYPPRLYLCLRFAAYLAIGPAQDSRPSRSLVLSRETLSFSTSYRFIPAHQSGDSTHDLLEGHWFSKFAFSPQPVVSPIAAQEAVGHAQEEMQTELSREGPRLLDLDHSKLAVRNGQGSLE